MIGTAIFASIESLFYLPAQLGCILLLASFWRLRNGLPSKLAVWATLIIIVAILIACLQLIPLSPELWSSLPGRQFVEVTFADIDQKLDWMPLSLAPVETVGNLIYSLPELALFFACLSLAPKYRKPIFVALIILAILSAALGLGQRSREAAPWLQIYNSPVAMGFFANHNFHAAFLYCSIPVAAALAWPEFRKAKVHPIVVTFFALAFLAVILVGLGAAGSRAATVLAMLAVIGSAIIFWRRQQNSTKRQNSKLPMLGFALVMFMVGQFG